MRGFKRLLVLGITMLTLLIIIDTIDAGKKQSKKKEVDSLNDRRDETNGNKNKVPGSIKPEKHSRKHKNENSDENSQFSKKSSIELKKPESKKSIKQASKDGRYKENVAEKNSKPSQKVKKYKIVEEESGQKLDSVTNKAKKLKHQNSKPENNFKAFKSVKNTSQKNIMDENLEKVINEELNRIKNEETFTNEENYNGNPKKKKYKLVEVVLQEDGQDEEDNETMIDMGYDDEELAILYEHIVEKSRNIKAKLLDAKLLKMEDENEESKNEEYFPQNSDENSEPQFNDGVYSYDESYSRYEDPSYEGCRRLPEDPNRQGPKKLVFYVVEEELSGKIQKRIVEEEDGVTMCEVAELLKQQNGLPVP